MMHHEGLVISVGECFGTKDIDCDTLEVVLSELGVELISLHSSKQRPDTATLQG